MVICCKVFAEELLDCCLVALLGHIICYLKCFVVIEAHEVACLLPCLDITSGLGTASAYIESSESSLGILVYEVCEAPVVLTAPFQPAVEYLLCGHTAYNILGYIAELVQIDKSSRYGHLVKGIGKFMIISLGVGDTPLLIVGVEQGKEEFPDSVPAYTLLLIVGQSQLGILSLGELSLAACFPVYLHKSCCVTVYGLLPAESIEELNVHGQ